MARAFAVFGNQGRDVTPIAIRSVEDRNGRVVLDVERDTRLAQRRMGPAGQVISPQNAYIMTRILEKTVEEGTLANGAGWGAKFTFKDEAGKSFRMPVAGKTGTPQNWSDAWAVGYSPYYTTAIWFGFDKPGNSLGVELTGSTLAGPVWGDYMREIHKGLSRRDFARPVTGIIDVTVCAKSGLLRNSACNEGAITLPFLEGTQPGQYCNIHGNGSWSAQGAVINSASSGLLNFSEDDLLGSLKMPTLPQDLLDGLQSANRNAGAAGQGNSQSRQGGLSWSFNNSAPFEPDMEWDVPGPDDETGIEAGLDTAVQPETAGGQTGGAAPPEAQYPLPADQPKSPNRGGPGLRPSAPDNGLELPSYNPLQD
jgi:penicillin-binding protein 1A